MKTFEQYINEARQNYIFGGTDDRNTKENEPKTFGQLKDGDYIYWWVNTNPRAIREGVFKDWEKQHGSFNTYEDSYTMEFLDKKQKVYKERFQNMIFIASTDAELIIDAVNGVGYNVDYKCIMSEKEYREKYRLQ